jgi:hypothetical protein
MGGGGWMNGSLLPKREKRREKKEGKKGLIQRSNARSMGCLTVPSVPEIWFSLEEFNIPWIKGLSESLYWHAFFN